MASNPNKVDSPEEVTVKLGLADAGENALFRLFDCHTIRHWSCTNSAVKNMKHQAILLHSGEATLPEGMIVSDFRIQLTYTDSDGDKILIQTDNDLVHARSEHIGAGRVRIFASVQQRQVNTKRVPQPVPSSPPQVVLNNMAAVPAAVAAPAVMPPPTEPRSVSEALPQTACAETQTVPAVTDDSKPAFFMSNRCVKDAQSPPVPLQSVVDSIVGLITTAALATGEQVRDAATAHAAATADRVAAKIDIYNKERQAAAAVAASVSKESDHVTKLEPTSETVEEPAAAVDEEDSDEYPFIHGRHTCDGCLTTPIIGTRYHAVNMSDYDLCASCRDNYKGNEMVFEVAELDRDRPFQERWNRRFHRWGVAVGPRHHMMNPHERRRAMQKARSERGRRVGLSPAAASEPSKEPSNEEVDMALKEAVRRSLEDVKSANKKADVDHEYKSLTKDNMANTKAAPATASLKDSAAVAPHDGVSDIKAISVPKSPAWKAAPIETLDEVVKTTTPPASFNGIPNDAASKTSSMTDHSFAEDAANNGAVARELGETFDKVVQVIDAMLNVELERISVPNDANVDEDMILDAASHQDGMYGEHKGDIVYDAHVEPVTSNGTGATIVDGSDDDDDSLKDDVSRGSWDVVGENPTDGDEALARAAQVIGSALFNSDMARSHASPIAEPVQSTAGSQVSSVTSVPTTVRSVTAAEPVVASAQRERWALQLAQLREIGFVNDTLTVEILERLAAGNIGVGSEDEVTVGQVINEIMRDW